MVARRNNVISITLSSNLLMSNFVNRPLIINRISWPVFLVEVGGAQATIIHLENYEIESKSRPYDY